MTMHLQKGLSTLNTRKIKFKMTKAKEASWREDFEIYNRELKRQGQPRLTWEQYMDMRLGKKSKTNSLKSDVNYSLGNQNPRFQDYIKMRNAHASVDPMIGNTNRRESQKYTGTYITGIATMHKSNAVPVTSKEYAVDLANMRRG